MENTTKFEITFRVRVTIDGMDSIRHATYAEIQTLKAQGFRLEVEGPSQPLTPAREQRVRDSLRETQALIKRESNYLPRNQNAAHLRFLETHRATLLLTLGRKTCEVCGETVEIQDTLHAVYHHEGK